METREGASKYLAEKPISPPEPAEEIGVMLCEIGPGLLF